MLKKSVMYQKDFVLSDGTMPPLASVLQQSGEGTECYSSCLICCSEHGHLLGEEGSREASMSPCLSAGIVIVEGE